MAIANSRIALHTAVVVPETQLQLFLLLANALVRYFHTITFSMYLTTNDANVTSPEANSAAVRAWSFVRNSAAITHGVVTLLQTLRSTPLAARCHTRRVVVYPIATRPSIVVWVSTISTCPSIPQAAVGKRSWK